MSAVKDADIRSAAWTGARDDISESGAVNVTNGDGNAAREAGIVREEVGTGDGLALLQVSAVKDPDFWSAARAGAGHHIGILGAVDAANGERDAAGESWGKGEEVGCRHGLTPMQVRPIEDLDVPAAARTRGHHPIIP